MARYFNSSFVLDFVQSFWREYYKDHAHIERVWDAAALLMDDEWAQLEQINDSSQPVSVPTLIYHTHLYRKLEDWESYGLPHRHFRKDWRSLAGQTVFYTGGWPDPATTQVFLNGKEADDLDDPYTVTFDQDATQPGINPQGVRLIFTNPIPAGMAVSLFADKELVSLDYEVPVGGATDIIMPAQIDPDSVSVVLVKMRITALLSFTTTSFRYTTQPSTLSDTRIFRRGEVFEVVDGASKWVVAVADETQVVSLSFVINPLTVQVFKMLDFDISPGKIVLDGNNLSAVDQVFPSGVTVRVADTHDSMGLTLTEPIRTIEYPRAVNPDSFHAYMLGGEVVDGYSSDSSTLHFQRSFLAGVILRIRAAIVTPNDHAEYREVVSSPVDRISVPVTRPFALSPTLQELPEYPIQFFIDGHLQAKDTYYFLSTTTIVLNAGIIPAGSVADLYYVDAEDPVPHFHVQEYFRVASPVSAFKLSDYVSDRFSRYVNAGGIEMGDPMQRHFELDGTYLAFQALLPTGTLVRVRGAHRSYAYHHALDDVLIRAAFMQNGIDELSSSISNGWTVQLIWDDTFTIHDEMVEADAKIEDAWFVDAYVDERTVYNNFGDLVGIDRSSSEEYTRIIKAMVPGRYMGSRTSVVESLACIVLGSEYIPVPADVESIVGTMVTAGGEEYEHDPTVSLRVSVGERSGRYEAISRYVSILDRWEPFDALALMGRAFSDDYTFARTLDVAADTTLIGGACYFRKSTRQLVDTAVDFIAEEVWPGDLVMARAVAAPADRIYGRVISVSQHYLVVDFQFTIPPAGYGSGYYSENAYGMSGDTIAVSDYKVWVRDTEKMDNWRHLDEARYEDIPYLTSRLHDLLSPFVFLAEIRWAAIRDSQALHDMIHVLDEIKPADTDYIAYTKVEEGDLSENVTGDVTDEDPVLTELPNFVFVTTAPEILSIIGINGQISPNVGSFIGV